MIKGRKRLSGIPAGIVMGVLVCILVTFAVVTVVAALVAGEKIAQERIAYGATAVILLAGFCGAFTAGSVAGERRMAVCMLCGAAYFLVLLCTTALLFDGMYRNIGLTALLIAGSSLSAALVGMKKKHRGYTGKKVRIRMP